MLCIYRWRGPAKVRLGVRGCEVLVINPSTSYLFYYLLPFLPGREHHHHLSQVGCLWLVLRRWARSCPLTLELGVGRRVGQRVVIAHVLVVDRFPRFRGLQRLLPGRLA